MSGLFDIEFEQIAITRIQKFAKIAKAYGFEIADKTMLDRACEWLKENIDLYSYNAFNVKSDYTEITLTDEFETAFRQAMKGGAE